MTSLDDVHCNDVPAAHGMDVDAVLTTAEVPLGNRFSFWREYVCRTIAGVEATALGDAGAGSIRRRLVPVAAMPDLDLIQVQADPQRVNRTRQLIGVTGDDSWLLMIQGVGTCAVRQGNRFGTLVAGDMAFLDTSRPYEVAFPQSFTQCILKVPSAVLDTMTTTSSDVAGLILSGQDGLVAIARQNLLLLDRLACTIDPTFLPTAAAHAIDHLMLAVSASGDPRLRARRTASALHFARANAHIAERLGDPSLSVGQIAKALGLSTGHLHEVFRDASGVSVADHVRRQRLDRCRRDLLDPSVAHQSISEIAFRWGFSESSSFSRAFRSAFKTSPRLYRRSIRRDAGSSGRLSDQDPSAPQTARTRTTL